MNETAPEATLRDLTDSVDRLSDEASDLRALLRSRTRALWVAIVVGGIILLVAIGAAVSVSLDNRQVSQDNKEAIAANNRRWCPVVIPLVPQRGDPPPVGSPEQVERALRIRLAFTKLADDFGCR